MISKQLLLIILVVFLGFYCVGAQTVPETGSISGKVLPFDSNATIYIFSPTQEVVGNKTIDINGAYLFDLPIGIYDIFIRPNGEYNTKTLFQIGVRENEVTKVQDIMLSKIGETGSISGYINPIIEGAVVKIKKFGLTEYAGESTVGDDGRYYFTNLEPGTYGLFVDFTQNQDYYSYKWGMIDVNADENLSGIDITFTPKNSSQLIDRVTVEFQPSTSEDEKKDILASFGSRIMSHYSYSGSYVASIPNNKTVEEMLDLLKTNSKVKDAYSYGISSIAMPMVESQLKYDSKILEELHKTAKVSVIAELYVQNMTKISDILSTLPETEFVLEKIHQSGNAFSGNITLQGYNALVRNPDIKIIYLSDQSSVSSEDKDIYDSENNSIAKDQIKNESIIKEKKSKSLLARFIQFFNSLFGLN